MPLSRYFSALGITTRAIEGSWNTEFETYLDNKGLQKYRYNAVAKTCVHHCVLDVCVPVAQALPDLHLLTIGRRPCNELRWRLVSGPSQVSDLIHQ